MADRMTFEEFQAFIDAQDALFKSVNKGGQGTEAIFARTIKLGEEYGELCDEVLAAAGDQRRDKMRAERDLEGEFADVVIVTFLLAKAMGVDMPEALRQKIEKIKEKHNPQIGGRP
ncbi:MAG TPA: MazG nucleotide pyrophosphohydrolase domain-containing protein [Candidatus Paceibacterota bacterium]|nr:MazG nucleotide pyrophosphohydrolase domain-containing protein [Candidatus Paceibacterota bacterium]